MPAETTTADAALGLYRVLSEDGTLTTSAPPELSLEKLRTMLRHMIRIRSIDEKMMKRQRQGQIGFYGSVTGQEAVPVAAGCALASSDWVFPALRENGIMLVRGFPLKLWLAQVYGNEMDVLKGRQMPSHMSARDVHQVSWSSCIGPQIPQAVGAAWAAKLRKDATVVAGFMGDGATSQGDVHAAMNFAGVFGVPCIFICQNNHWSISVPSSRQTASATFAIKAKAYGMPGVRVDGNDVLALHGTIEEAANRARQGLGPTFIEAVTYRIGPHSSSDDPDRYRDPEEVALWTKRDPIHRLQNYLRQTGRLSEEAVETMHAEIDSEISSAVAAVESLPNPARSTLFEDVYHVTPWHLIEQREELEKHPPAPLH
ncbi:MAG: thiamine pyrophosphate-dependent dehydrogenase E1 component subunit alpha [Myxococcota bacterium]